MSRRNWLATSLAGMVAGGMWGGALRVLATPTGPTLSVIGRDTAQIALLDTLSVRVLVVINQPDSGLVDRIPALMTVMKQRIDIVIASTQGATSLGASFEARWNVNHTIIIPEDFDVYRAPTSHARSLLNRGTTLDLGRGVTVELMVTSRDGWNNSPANLLWSMKVSHYGIAVVLGPNDASLLATSIDRPSLIVAPQITTFSIGKKLTPGGIAVNANDRQDIFDDDRNFALTSIYPEDIGRFTFKENGIELPAWTSPGTKSGI